MSARFFVGKFVFGLDAPVAADVCEGDPLLGQRTANEQAAVAGSGVLLAAQDRDPVLAHALLKAIEGLDEDGRLRYARIDHAATGVVERGALGLSAQLLPQKDVLESRAHDGCHEPVLIELRGVRAIGARPYVGHGLDAVHLKQAEQDLGGMVRMADGKDASFRPVAVRGDGAVSFPRRTAHPCTLPGCAPGVSQRVARALL